MTEFREPDEKEEVMDYPDMVEKPSWEEMVATSQLTDIDIYNIGSGSEIDWKYLENVIVTNAHIESLDAGKITTGTLSADRIAANSITADKLFASYIEIGGAATDTGWQYTGTTKIDGGQIQTGTVTADYVVANISISSPTITGGTLQTSTSGQRVTIVDDEIRFHDSSNDFVATLYADSANIWIATQVGKSINMWARDTFALRADGYFDITGNIYPSTGDTYSIGGSASANRWKDLYLSGDANVGGESKEKTYRVAKIHISSTAPPENHASWLWVDTS